MSAPAAYASADGRQAATTMQQGRHHAMQCAASDLITEEHSAGNRPILTPANGLGITSSYRNFRVEMPSRQVVHCSRCSSSPSSASLGTSRSQCRRSSRSPDQNCSIRVRAWRRRAASSKARWTGKCSLRRVSCFRCSQSCPHIRRSSVEPKTCTTTSTVLQNVASAGWDHCMSSRAERDGKVGRSAVHGHAQSNSAGLHIPATTDPAASTQLHHRSWHGLQMQAQRVQVVIPVGICQPSVHVATCKKIRVRAQV